MLLRPEHRVERRRDELDAARRALPHMAARMEIVEIPRRRLEPREIIRERLPRERPQRRLRRAGVQRIRRVRDDRPESLRARERAKRRHVLCSERLRAAAARIAREKRERIRAERDCLAPHRLVALRGRHMRPDVKWLHPVSSLQACARPRPSTCRGPYLPYPTTNRARQQDGGGKIRAPPLARRQSTGFTVSCRRRSAPPRAVRLPRRARRASMETTAWKERPPQAGMPLSSRSSRTRFPKGT